MTRYPSDRLAEEVAFLSYYFHWPYEQVMAMDHQERLRWVAELSRLNNQRNQTQQEATWRP